MHDCCQHSTHVGRLALQHNIGLGGAAVVAIYKKFTPLKCVQHFAWFDASSLTLTHACLCAVQGRRCVDPPGVQALITRTVFWLRFGANVHCAQIQPNPKRISHEYSQAFIAAQHSTAQQGSADAALDLVLACLASQD